MPIYEYYCPDNHRIYQFYAKTLAQGQTIPRCPANPAFRMVKMVSPFAVSRKGRGGAEAGPAEGAPAPAGDPGDSAEDAKMEAAMSAMESEFSSVDENDPRAMGRMMRRMAELTGEKIDGPMEEMVRKLEEGADPDSLEEELGDEGGDEGGGGDDEGGPPAKDPKEAKHRFRARRGPPVRDPKLYDY